MLIKCELFKLRKSVCYKVLLLGTVLYALTDIYFLIGFREASTGFQAILESFNAWGRCLMLGCIFAGVFIGGDFDNRILHAEIAVGNSRKRVFLAKAVVYEAACMVLPVFYQIVYVAGVSLLFGFGCSIEAESLTAVVKLELAYLILFGAFLAVSMLTAFLFKSVFAVTAVEGVWLILGSSLLRNMGKLHPLLNALYEKTIYYLINNLTTPFYEEVILENQIPALALQAPEQIQNLLPLQHYGRIWPLTVPVLLIFTAGAYLLFKKTELK